MAMPGKWAVILLAGTAAVVGCRAGSDTPPTPVSALLGSSWNCLAAPTAFDGPGSIFRVTPDGTKFTVADFAPQAGIQKQPFVAPTATQTVDVGVGVAAQIIGVPVSADIAASNKVRVTQSFGGAEEHNTTDDAVRGIIGDFYARADLDRTQRYYLVRRAIVARAIKYDFDRDFSASLGLDVAVEVARIRPSARYSRTGGASYEETFQQPQNVCVIAQALPVPRPPAAAPAAPPAAAASDVPLFRTVGR